MIFISLLTYKQGLSRYQIDDAAQRRARWKYPSELELIGEYWVQGIPQLIIIIEAEDIAPVLQSNHSWADVFDIQTYPAMTVDEGLRTLQRAGIVRRRGRRPKALVAAMRGR